MKHRRYSTFLRPDAQVVVYGSCKHNSAIAGIAIAGCMTAGVTTGRTHSTPPSGTFNTNTL